MTTVIRNLDLLIDNPALPVIFGPFTSVPGLVGGWRFSGGNPLADLSGNGRALSAEGSPSQADYYVTGNKTNGYVTDIGDMLNVTLIVVARLKSSVQDYGPFLSSLRQNASGNGVGVGVVLASNPAANISRDQGVIGNTAYDAALAASVQGQAGTFAERTAFRFIALALDAAAGTARLFQPRLSTVPVTVTDADISTRTVAGRVFRIGSWSNPADLPQPGEYDIAEALIYSRALSDSEVLTQYNRSKTYMAGFGESI